MFVNLCGAKSKWIMFISLCGSQNETVEEFYKKKLTVLGEID